MLSKKRDFEAKFSLFSKLPTVLIELSLSFLKLSDLLKAGRAFKAMKDCSERVLERVTILSIAFFPPCDVEHCLQSHEDSPIVFNLLKRMKSLEEIHEFVWDLCLPNHMHVLSNEQRIALHPYLPHLRHPLFVRMSDLEVAERELPHFRFDSVLHPGYRSFPLSLNELTEEQLERLDACCPRLEHNDFCGPEFVAPFSQHLLNIVARCRSLSLNRMEMNESMHSILKCVDTSSLRELAVNMTDLSDYDVLSFLGIEKLSRSLTSLHFYSISAASLSLLLSVEWPSLTVFDCTPEAGPADLLNQLASRMPALTDLSLRLKKLDRDPAHPKSCCLSVASATRLASQLRSLTVHDDRGVDLLSQLARHSCRLESLMGPYSADPCQFESLRHSLSKMDHLTSVTVWQDEESVYEDPKICDVVAAGLLARSDECNAQLRSVHFDPLSDSATAELMSMLLRVRPVLEDLEVWLSPDDEEALLKAKQEERKKGSGRLLLYFLKTYVKHFFLSLRMDFCCWFSEF